MCLVLALLRPLEVVCEIVRLNGNRKLVELYPHEFRLPPPPLHLRGRVPKLERFRWLLRFPVVLRVLTFRIPLAHPVQWWRLAPPHVHPLPVIKNNGDGALLGLLVIDPS